MPTFYVQSGRVQVILDTDDAEQAAITAFQWWCECQTEAMFAADTEDCQLGNEVLVSKTGFGAGDAELFPTLDILMAWQVEPVDSVGLASDPSVENKSPMKMPAGS
jgi:hypothetical protein